MNRPASPEPPTTSDGWRDDPPPFPWLDDPTRATGPTPPGFAIVVGVVFVLMGLFAVGLGLAFDDHARVARIACGAPFVFLGAGIAHMGTARRAWRRRHPGVDPVSVAATLGANVGDPLGNDSRVARMGRWVLVLLCAFIVFVCVVSVVLVVTGRSSGSVGSIIAVVLLGLFAGAIGVKALQRERR